MINTFWNGYPKQSERYGFYDGRYKLLRCQDGVCKIILGFSRKQDAIEYAAKSNDPERQERVAEHAQGFYRVYDSTLMADILPSQTEKGV